MIVPNFIPPPIEVPGNASESLYRVRLRFIRGVTGLFLLAAGLVTVMGYLPWPPAPWWQVAVLYGIFVLALDLVRIWRRGHPVEARISAASLILILPTLGWLVHLLRQEQIPIWAITHGLAGLGLYTVLCGRDYSFVGAFLSSWALSSATIAIKCLQIGVEPGQAGLAIGLNSVVLAYVVYDFASLMARRRVTEQAAAVTDLFRDFLNFFGYAVRVVEHWRKYRIFGT